MSPTERDSEHGGNQMTETRKRRSTVILILELLRDMAVYIDLELKLAIAEFRRNIGSAKKGIIQMAIGLFLLLLALLLLTCSSIAALAIVLPLWLASLIVGLHLCRDRVMVCPGREKQAQQVFSPSHGIVRKDKNGFQEAERVREIWCGYGCFSDGLSGNAALH